MSIFLNVLAVIGIILLVIVLVILALLLILLFVPIRFKLDARLDRLDFENDALQKLEIHIKSNEQTGDTKKEDQGISQILGKLHLNAFAHWLLYLVRACVKLNDTPAAAGKVSDGKSKSASVKEAEVRFSERKLIGSVKILFFTLFPKKEKENKQKTKTSKKADKGKKSKSEDVSEGKLSPDESKTMAVIENTATNDQNESADIKEEEKKEEKKQPAGDEPKTTKQLPQKQKSINQSDEEDEQSENESFSILSFFLFLWRVFGFLIGLINQPYAVFQKFLYTISGIRDKISLVRDLLETNTWDRGKSVLLKQTKRLSKGLLPKKCKVSIGYGTGDPCLTAKILAVYSILYPLFKGHVQVDPDFEHKYAEAEIHLKGRLTLFRVLWCLGTVYFNKDLRRIKKRLEYIKNLK